MTQTTKLYILRTPSALIAFTLLIGLTISTNAQEPEKEPIFQPLNSIVRKGFTRPGSPSDGVKQDGEIQRVAFSGSYKGLGGTVFFVVLERLGEEGDTWGIGRRGLDQSFEPGLDFDGKYSPRLDREAKYLYLYQVVNDRGLEPIPIKPIRWNEGEPIASVMVRLRVDPRFITSWGQFRNQAILIGDVAQRKFDGTVAIADDEKQKTAILPVSAFPGVQHELIPQPYEVLSPAYSISNPYALGQANFKGAAAVIKDVEVLPVAFQGNIKNAAARANHPKFVQLAYTNIDGPIRLAQEYNQFLSGKNIDNIDAKNFRPANFAGQGGEQLVFRADWPNKDVIKVGQNSVVFGFTSDLPPIDEPVVLQDPEAVKTDIQTVAFDDGAALAELASGIAPGTVPSPQPPAPAPPAAVPVAGGVGFGSLGGQVGGGSAGGVAGVGIPAGFGTSPGGGAGITGGGGSNGGGEGGGEGGGGNGNNGENGDSGSKADVIVNQTQNVNQFQAQRQRQRQRQRGGDNPPPGGVIPEPGALLLGLMGLPALYYVARRRKKPVLSKEEIVA